MITNEKNKEDILFILQNLRKEDELEARELIGEDYIFKTSETILGGSDKFFLAKDDNNVPYAMGGYNHTEEKGAVSIWLLSTDEIKKHKCFVLRKIKEELNNIEKENWFIFNYIFEKNYLAKNWLKKLGFIFVSNDTVPDGFELFFKKRNVRGLE